MLDVRTPNGVVDGFLYVSAVLLCHWVSDLRAPLYLASGLMPAMWLGFLASENASPLWMSITNRTIAMATVWVAAIVVWRNLHHSEQVASTLDHTAKRLESSNREAVGDRTGIANWLREDIALELNSLDRRLHRAACILACCRFGIGGRAAASGDPAHQGFGGHKIADAARPAH